MDGHAACTLGWGGCDGLSWAVGGCHGSTIARMRLTLCVCVRGTERERVCVRVEGKTRVDNNSLARATFALPFSPLLLATESVSLGAVASPGDRLGSS